MRSTSITTLMESCSSKHALRPPRPGGLQVLACARWVHKMRKSAGPKHESLTPNMINHLLEPFGLLLLGTMCVTPEDSVPDAAEHAPARHLLLIGNGGSSLWPVFSRSPECRGGGPDPLDHWSRRVGEEIAAGLGGHAVFPFEGPPYPPFLSWAQKTGQVAPSRISMFIHAQFGLWHAYRFALALPGPLHDLPAASGFASPCLDCAEQPCLDACPVQAFTGDDYRVDQCMDYLASSTPTDCRKRGCLARRACPVGLEFTYQVEHARFHMDAFLAACRA